MMGDEGGEPPVTVLIIEDEDELSQIYEFQLQRLGDFDIVSVCDGGTALETLDDTFDLVLTDWQLPHLGGRELLEQLNAAHPDCSVVVVSGYEPPENIDELPCDDYLVKPVTSAEWAALIDEFGVHGETPMSTSAGSISQ